MGGEEMNDWEAPYKKIQAAEDLLEHNALVGLYTDLYKKKYRTEPIFPITNQHLNQIRMFKKAVGDKAYAILQAYFDSKDAWFLQQSHSMDCLLKNVNKIAPIVARQQAAVTTGLQIEMLFNCDSCEEPFRFICDIGYKFMDKLTRCPMCAKENRPGKKVSKEDYRKIVLKAGNAFPEMPLDCVRDTD